MGAVETTALPISQLLNLVRRRFVGRKRLFARYVNRIAGWINDCRSDEDEQPFPGVFRNCIGD